MLIKFNLQTQGLIPRIYTERSVTVFDMKALFCHHIHLGEYLLYYLQYYLTYLQYYLQIISKQYTIVLAVSKHENWVCYFKRRKLNSEIETPC